VNFDAADDDDFDFSNSSLFPPGVTNNAHVDLSGAWPRPTNSTPVSGSNRDSAPYPSPSSGHIASIPTPTTSPSIAFEANVAAAAPPTSKKRLPPLVSHAKCQKCNKTFVDSLHLGRHTEKCIRSASFECDRCSEVCSEQRLLERHVLNIHDKIDMVFCECRPDKLMRKDNLPRHKKTCRLTRAT
jgi:hypothetical protein